MLPRDFTAPSLSREATCHWRVEVTLTIQITIAPCSVRTHFSTGKDRRRRCWSSACEGTTSFRGAKVERKQCRPATPVKISSTRLGRIRSCATLSTQSRKSKPIHCFKNSSAGFTSSSQARSSERGETGPEPASLTADQRVLGSRGFLVPLAQSTERTRPKRRVAGESPAGDTISGA